MKPALPSPRLTTRPPTILAVLSLLAGLNAAAVPASTPALYNAALNLSSGYAATSAELSSARAALARLQRDPLALRADLLSAQGRVQAAEARVRAATLDTRAQLATDLLSYQSALDARSLAQAQLDAAQLAQKGVQYRAQNGAATALDVNQAQAELRNAQAALAAAQADVGAAQSALVKRAGGLPPSPKSWSLPSVSLTALDDALDGLPSIVAAKSDLSLAQYRLKIVLGDVSSAQDVQAAREAATNAQSQLDDLERQGRAALRRAWTAYQSALASIGPRERLLQVAQNAYRVQQSRYATGAAALLTVKKAYADVVKADADLDTARLTAEGALITAGQAANFDPWRGGK